MSYKLLRYATVSLAAYTTAYVAFSQDNNADEEVFELSPFEVTPDEGYVANSSLAGTRLNSQLVDLASSIDVLTEDLMDDIAATSIDEAVQYSVNSDVDIGAVGSDNGDFEYAAGRVFIRGLPANRTKDYFPITHNLDRYNIGRVEENRGPNSILFGIGSPSGIVNASTKQAIRGNSFRKADLMYTSAGGYRAAVDLNFGGGDGPLAIRFNAVHKRLDDELQWYETSSVDAAHLAFTAKLSEKVTLRGGGEVFEENSVVGKTRSYGNGLGYWVDAGRPLVSGTLTTAEATENGVRKDDSQRIYVENVDAVVYYRDLYRSNGDGRVLYEGGEDGEYWNRSINEGGPGQGRFNKGNNAQLALEAKLSDKTFLELSAYRGEIEGDSYLLGLTGNLGFSVSEFLRDGVTPNPGVVDGEARPYVQGQWRHFGKDSTYLSYRATLSHDLDLERFGEYRFALMLERDDETYRAEQRREHYIGEDGKGLFNSGNSAASANRVYRRYYPEEGDWADYHSSNPEFAGFLNGVMAIGDAEGDASVAYSSAWRNQNQQAYDSALETAMLGVQARYFNNHLIVGAGVRKDNLEKRTYSAVGYRNDLGESYVSLDDYADSTYKGDTTTVGAVYHINDSFRLMYNQSDNFGLPHPSRFEYPNAGAGANTTGEGRDYGIGFRILDNKVSGRLTRFEVDSTGSTVFGFNLQDIQTNLLNALVAAHAEDSTKGISQAQADPMFIYGSGDLINQSVEGYEFSLTANPTKNWRMTVKYSFTDGIQSDSYPDTREWRDGNPSGRLGDNTGLEFFDNPDFRALPMVIGSFPNIGAYLDDTLSDLDNALSFDGMGLPKNRKHKYRGLTRYDFRDGKLKSFFIGGGVNYMDGPQLSVVEVPDGENYTAKGTSYWTADLLAGYTFKKVLGIDRLKVQLNVSNLFDHDDPIITSYTRTEPIEVNRVTFLAPRSWRLSAGFDF